MPQRQPSVIRSAYGLNRPTPPRRHSRGVGSWFRRSRLAQFLLLMLVIIAVVGAISAVHKPVDKSNYDDINTVISALSKHVLLPTDEKPLLATVTDRNALKTPFLKQAANGDRILIYEKAKRVIIYRPTSDRIVDIGPVELANIPAVKQ